MLKTLLRYWHTLRHLKPIQIVWRLRVKILPVRVRQGNLAVKRRSPPGLWTPPAPKQVSLLSPGSFRFVGTTLDLPSKGGWNDVTADKLWLYNLHYFDDLNAEPPSPAHGWHEAWIARWIAENPTGEGVGWEPYPTSLRIVNWIKWLNAGHVPVDGMIEALAWQARFLHARLEWHLLGNHLFANAKALVFAGLFFEGEEAEAWKRTGLEIIASELDEQVLGDGGNFERSPMYHAIFLEDVLDLVNAGRIWRGELDDAAVRNWAAVSERMLSFLDGLTHPDGEIALFNDAAFGIAPTLADLSGYADRLGVSWTRKAGCHAWLNSGYVRLETERATAFIDVGPVGPDYLPGHAHADTLSFELSLDGRRVVVNGGTSQYGASAERVAERGTAAHSTVIVDGADSSEVWGGFRVARRARPVDLAVDLESGTVSCGHDGYRRLPGRPLHFRTWQLTGRSLVVKDRVSGAFSTATAHYHLAPEIEATLSPGGAELSREGAVFARVIVVEGRLRLTTSRYSPRFGVREATGCLAVDLDGAGFATIRLEW